MAAAYVCSSCRRELQRRISRLFPSQCVSKASFISLVNVVPPTNDQEQHPNPPQTLPPTPQNGNSSLGDLAREQRPQNPKLEELFTSKDAPTQLGRYSRGRILQQPTEPHNPVHDQEAAVRTRNLQNLRLHQQPEVYKPLPAERAPQRYNGNVPEPDWSNIIDGTQIQRRSRSESVSAEHKIQVDRTALELHKLLLDSTKDSRDLWAFFEQHYAPKEGFSTALRYPNREDHTYLKDGKIFQRILNRMIETWDINSEESKTPSQVIQTLADLDLMRPGFYVDALWKLLIRTIQSDSQDHNAKSTAILRNEVLQVWAIMFKYCGKVPLRDHNYIQEGKINWMGLPARENMRFGGLPSAENRDLGFRMLGHFQNVPMLARTSLSAAAVATFDLFLRQYSQSSVSEGLDTNHKPFTQYVLLLLLRSDPERTLDFLKKQLERKVNTTQLDALLDRLKEAPFRAALALGSDSLGVFTNSKVQLTSDQQTKLDVYIASRIGKFLEKKQTPSLVRLWEQFQGSPSSGKTSIPLGSLVYDNLIYAFDKLNQPNKTVEVWNHMITNGAKPTPSQWFALLRGRSKDPATMEKVWRRMLSAGVQPDVNTWGVRILSLLLWGPKAEDGLLALDDMTKAWFAAVEKAYPTKKVGATTEILNGKQRKGQTKPTEILEPKRRPKLSDIGDLTGAPKPNVFILNSCISGLTKRRHGKQKRVDLIPQVFNWASGLGIKADVFTFNLLINMCMDDGNMKEAMQMMKEMENQNIEPDLATFTIFLNYIFKPKNRVEHISTEEQEQAIESILDLVDAHGLTVGPHLFSTLIDGLLKVHNNLAGASQVFDQMIARNIAVRPHVWTSFLTYHLQQADDPQGPGVPNFFAIESLWSRILSSRSSVDTIFYDRMIEGYARFGEIDQAMMFLTRMKNEAKKPGWPCVTAVLRALLQQGLRDRALEIVHDVENSDGLLPHGMLRDHQKFNPDRDLFWQVAMEAGLRKTEPRAQEVSATI